MPAQSLSTGIVVGGVTAAATTGALVAMGHRAGNAALPFAAISAAVLHRTSSSSAAGLVLGGLVLHVVAAFVWSLVFVWIAERLRTDVVAAVLTAAANFAGSWLVAAVAGNGIATVLPLGDRLVLAVVWTLALVVGMRFALPATRSA